jgi:EmrB/QacA subfamily drug resistance transporter
MSQIYGTISKRREQLILATMCLAVIVVIANVASLNVAVPQIGAALQADQSQLQWIVDSYALVLAAFLLPAGALGDRYSRKTMLIIGLVVMTAASWWSASASSATELILARGVAGLGAAFVFPSTLSTLTALTAPERRQRAIALWSACTAIGGILGIIGSGAILESHSWPWIFRGTAGISALALVLVLFIVVDTRDPDHAHLDPPGTVLSVLAAGGLVLGITEGPARGWTDPLTLGGLVVGVVALLTFVWWELRARRPLLDVRLFAQADFGSGSLAVFLLFFSTFGAFFLCVQFVAYVYGYGPLDSGLALLPVGATLVPTSILAVVVSRRFGRAVAMSAGMAIFAGGLLVLSTLDESADYGLFAVGLLIFGAGIGLCSTPATDAIVAALPSAKQGVASAVNDTARELGGALGIAVLGTLLNVGYRSGVDAAGLAPEVADVVRESPALGLGLSASEAGSPEVDGSVVIGAVRSAFVDGWALALIVGAVVVLAGAVAVAVIGRRRQVTPDVPTEPATAAPETPPVAVGWPACERTDFTELPLAESEPELAPVPPPPFRTMMNAPPEPPEPPYASELAASPEPPNGSALANAFEASADNDEPVEAVVSLAAAPWPTLAEEEALAGTMQSTVREAESVLAALRLLVREQHATLARLRAREDDVRSVRSSLAEQLELAASRLRDLEEADAGE